MLKDALMLSGVLLCLGKMFADTSTILNLYMGDRMCCLEKGKVMVIVGDVNQTQCRRAYSRQQLVSFNGGRRTAHAPSIVSKVNT